jgi:hypothetical protein
MKQQVKISKVKGNPSNPRIIKNDKFKKLVKSIQEFPEMLKLRPIVVDEDMMVLGGNMRLKASKDAGLKEVWIEVAEGLTEEQKKEFIVKDNVGFGEWDWDMLGNEWDNAKLGDWGMDVWQPEKDNWNESGNKSDVDMLEGYLNKETGVLKFSFSKEEYKEVVSKLVEITEKENLSDFSEALINVINFYNENN